MAGRLTPRTCLLAREGGSAVDFKYRSWGFCWRMNGVIMRFFKLVVGRKHKTCGSPDRQGRKLLDKLNMCDDSERVHRVGLTAMRDPGTKEQYGRERFQKPQTGKFSPQI